MQHYNPNIGPSQKSDQNREQDQKPGEHVQTDRNRIEKEDKHKYQKKAFTGVRKADRLLKKPNWKSFKFFQIKLLYKIREAKTHNEQK